MYCIDCLVKFTIALQYWAWAAVSLLCVCVCVWVVGWLGVLVYVLSSSNSSNIKINVTYSSQLSTAYLFGMISLRLTLQRIENHLYMPGECILIWVRCPGSGLVVSIDIFCSQIVHFQIVRMKIFELRHFSLECLCCANTTNISKSKNFQLI